ncbi:hypothetical protein BDV23DRAFT_147116 [Aspergillus alliaceus]|uniref:N-acetyltransferase domain-containing protein n=1 Tax=Petromyces alliaceus TaxID=209559 RepID=A0A5N7CKR0_PETAA|nr:hypothetical protein BDV23DRAFT_147116 [Aspergillus alliaceus]
MPLKLEVALDEDILELIRVKWRAFENPPQGILRIFYPIIDNDYEKSIKIAAEKELAEYREKRPEVMYVKVIDTDNGNRIVGGSKWWFYQRNPFEDNDQPAEADWYPEGIARRYVTEAMHQAEAGHHRMAQRPHAYLNIAFTDPDYQRCGVGQLFLEWGIKRADELQLESWVDSSAAGFKLYQKNGFIKVADGGYGPIKPEGLTAEEEAKWAELEALIPPTAHPVMWRPLGGKYIEGETVKPWET